METAQALVDKNRNNPQPEGRQARLDTHCIDYEVSAGQQYFSGNRVSSLIQAD